MGRRTKAPSGSPPRKLGSFLTPKQRVAAGPRTPTPVGSTRRAFAAFVSQNQRTWYLLRRNTLGLVGLGIILALVIMAVYAATLPLPWNEVNVYCHVQNIPGCTYVCTYTPPTPQTPTCYPVNAEFTSFIGPTLSLTAGAGALPLGSMSYTPTYPQFFNVEQGILRGADWSLIISVSIVAAGALIGLLVGVVAGFFGGSVDEALMRLVDIFLSIPQILFVIVTAAVFSNFSVPGLTSLDSHVLLLCLAFIVVWWPFYARIVRGQVLVVREQKYIEAARASGASKGRMIVKHIVPNSTYPVFIQMSLDVGTIPLLVGALSFLGFHLFGIDSLSQVFPEWGSLAAYSVGDFASVFSACELGTCIIPWWQIFFPGLMLFLFAIGVNFFADGLRDALDPRLRR